MGLSTYWVLKALSTTYRATKGAYRYNERIICETLSAIYTKGKVKL